MFEVKFLHSGYEEYQTGFAPIKPSGQQADYIQKCKEVFSHRIVGWNGSGGNKDYVIDGIFRFIHRDYHLARNDPREWASFKGKTLHVVEKEMGFKPLAKCSPIKNGNKVFLLYEVSKDWATSQPIAHILALLVRNHHPVSELPSWEEVLKTIQVRRRMSVHTLTAMKEIVEAKGKIRPDIVEGNGISDYARNLRHGVLKV